MIHEQTINSFVRSDNKKMYVFLNPKVATTKKLSLFYIKYIYTKFTDNHSSILYVPDLSNFLITHII